jgi:hypothetical protein
VSPIEASTSRTSATALVRSDAGRRILTGDGEGALAGMRVGAVLHTNDTAKIRRLVASREYSRSQLTETFVKCEQITDKLIKPDALMVELKWTPEIGPNVKV